MKLRTNQNAGECGSVLLVSLGTALIIGATLASYLLLVQNQSASVARSQVWNDTMVVTEAGIEDALQLVNKHAATPNLPGWTNDAAADNWSIVGNVYSVRRYIGGQTNVYYDAYITNLVQGQAILAIGHAPLPSYYGQAAAPGLLAAAGLSVDHDVALIRRVIIQTTNDPLFNFALAAKGKIDLKGNNVATDSFDSSSTNYSNPDGSYNPSLNKDGGNVISNGTVTNSIGVGNADIMGKVATGPNGTVNIGANGSVGSKTWVESGSSGVESGWSSSDMNVQFPDVPPPDTIYDYPSWYTVPPLGSQNVTVAGTNYDLALTNAGTIYYKPTSLSGDIYIGTNVNAILWVDGNSSFSGSDQIVIAPGGSLTIYSAGSFSISGQAGINNLTKDASKFTLLGLPTCTSISLTGNGNITGVVYAPEADLTIGGGGSDTYDFVGSAMAKTVTMNGHMHFHYDEALKARNFGRGFIATDWKEAY